MSDTEKPKKPPPKAPRKKVASSGDGVKAPPRKRSKKIHVAVESKESGDNKEAPRSVFARFSALESDNVHLKNRLSLMEIQQKSSELAISTLRNENNFLQEKVSKLEMDFNELRERQNFTLRYYKRALDTNCHFLRMSVDIIESHAKILARNLENSDINEKLDNYTRQLGIHCETCPDADTPPPTAENASTSNGFRSCSDLEAAETKCLFCDSPDHKSTKCSKFPSSWDKRYKLIEKNLCVRCLEPNDFDSKEHNQCTRKDAICEECQKDVPGLFHDYYHHHPVLCRFNDDKSS